MTSSLTPAARNAAYRAARDIARRIAPSLQATADEIEFRGGRVGVRNRPDTWMSFKDAVRRGHFEEICHRVERNDDYEGYMRRAGDLQFSRHGLGGVQFAEVCVDTETGVVRVERVLAVHDSPTPPPERLTLGLAALAQAAEICVAAFGAEKAAALQQAFDAPASALPVVPEPVACTTI